MTRVWMAVQHPPLGVHEAKVHTHVYSYSGAETTRYRHASVSRAVERGVGHVVGYATPYVGRPRSRIFPYDSRGVHNNAGLSWFRIFSGPGQPLTKGMCQVHG